MYKPDATTPAPSGRTATLECCTEPGCESGLRNNYFPGKRLSPEMFRIEQRYLLERRRLLNRAIHGWGVVYGYGLKASAVKPKRQKGFSRRLLIQTGFALDACGRELLQAQAFDLDLDRIIVVDEKGVCPDASRKFAASHDYGYKPQQQQQHDPDDRMCWLLSVHYAEQPMGGQSVADPCHCDRHEWDHTCETVRYSLRRIPCRQCCDDHKCELTCECASGPCCDHHIDKGADAEAEEKKYGREPHHRHHPQQRGGCQCLCEHLKGLDLGKDCSGRLCEVEEPCGHVRMDIDHGVPLACIEIVPDDCGGWTFGETVEDCGPRRLVKRNDLLFDLIRGCDLTRISRIGWHDWHRRTEPVPFNEFRHAMGPTGDHEAEYVTRDFWVRFSRPVRAATVQPDCFAITVMSVDTEGGWWQPMRVPIVRVETETEPGNPDHVRKATLVVDGSWLEDGCDGRHSVFLAGETWVEIEVRGDFILDCNGQTVDANAAGLSRGPTGNGSPGGTFLSSFRVAKREGHVKGASHEPADSGKGASS